MNSGSDRPFPDRDSSEPARGTGPGQAQPGELEREWRPIPPRPTRPAPPAAPDDAAARRRGCVAMLLAGFLVLMALAALAFLSQGYMIPVVLIAGLVFLYIFFHYVVWGWWLGNIIREEARQEDEANQALKQAENHPQ